MPVVLMKIIKFYLQKDSPNQRISLLNNQLILRKDLFEKPLILKTMNNSHRVGGMIPSESDQACNTPSTLESTARDENSISTGTQVSATSSMPQLMAISRRSVRDENFKNATANVPTTSSAETSTDSDGENDNQTRTDIVSRLKNSVGKMRNNMFFMTQKIEYLKKENKSIKKNSRAFIEKQKEIIEKLTIENENLTKENVDLTNQIEAQKSEEIDSRETNRKFDCGLSVLQKKVQDLEDQQSNMIRTLNMQREIDNLKLQLSKTNDDVTTLKAQLHSSSGEIQRTKEYCTTKIEKVLRKYDQQKIRIKDLERNVTDNKAHIYRVDQTVNVLWLTGLAGVRTGIHGQQTSTSPEQFAGHVHRVVSPTIAATSSSRRDASSPRPPPPTLSSPPPPPPPPPTNVPSSDDTRKQSDGGAPLPPPPPPPPRAPSMVQYDRIAMSDDLLKTVTLTPPGDKPRKIKISGRVDMVGLVARCKAAAKESREAAPDDDNQTADVPPPPPLPWGTENGVAPPSPGIPRVYERIPITVELLQTVSLRPASERQLGTPPPPEE